MSTTVFEALQNAQLNFETVGNMGAKGNPIFSIAMEQLNNAINALGNDIDPHEIIQESVFGDVDTEKR